MHRREAVFLLRKLLVAGGDGRMLRMARMLAGDGFAVSTLGLVSGDEKEAGIPSAEALLFPYPFAVRDGRVPTLTGLTLHPEDVLETGYGRFGRALAVKLKMLGTDVWVAARREEQRLAARSDGMRAASLAELPALMGRVDMVLNTIPARVLGTEALAALPKGAWLLELASAPYGFDRDAAARLGLNVEVLPALPARYAPQSAARALKQVSLELLREASL